MKRITLNLDLEDNEVLSKEVESMIKATVEHRFKGYVDSLVDDEVNERINERISQWQANKWSRKSRIDEAIDEAIQKSIKIPELNKDEVYKFLNEKVMNREQLFQNTLAKCLNEENVRKYISNEIERQMKEVLSNKLLEALFKKD